MPERIVVVGAAGFGRESLDVLDAMIADGAPLKVLGVLDDRPSETDLSRLRTRGTAYLGTIEAGMGADASVGYVLGIGSPGVRRRLVAALDAAGLSAAAAVHPRASLGSQTVAGEGAVVCAGAVISTNVRMGRHVHVNPNATIGHDTILEDFVSVNPGAVVSGAVHVGAGTLIGASATILQQLRIGRDVMVGAGAVVTRDVPDGVVVKGVPGRW